jgi:hypothetical protein
MRLPSRSSASPVVDEDGRDVPVVEIPEPVDDLAGRRLDGQHLHIRVLLLQVAAHAEQCARGSQSGHEVGHLGAVSPDLWSGPLVVGLRVGGIGILVEENPLGVLGGQRLGPTYRTVGSLGARGLDDLAPHTSSSWRRSMETLVANTTFRWYPFNRQTRAMPMPVLPDDGSMSVWPGLEEPSFSAVLDHGEGDAVLDRAAGILTLQLDQDADVGIGAQLR